MTLALARHPEGYPFIGSFKLFTETTAFLMRTRAYGDRVVMRSLGKRMLFLYDPDDVEHVLVTAQKKYIKDLLLQRAQHVLGNGLLRGEGDSWLRQRRLMQPMFHKQKVEGYAKIMQSLTDRFIQEVKAGSEANFHVAMGDLTSKIAMHTLFGEPPSDIHYANVGPHIDDIMQRFETVGHFFEPAWWKSKSFRRYLSGIRGVDEVVAKLIAHRQHEPGDDLLSLLLSVRDENGEGMNMQQVRDEVITLYIAGHETTALTLVYTWYLLAKNASSVEAQGSPNDPKWLDAVIKESMRLYPAAYAVAREALTDDDINGLPVRKGDTVLLPINAIQRDPRHFEAPDDFRPSRWTSEFERELPRYAYFPFGGGPRQCIGTAFAMMELRIVLKSLLEKFVPTLTSDAPIEQVSSVTARPRNGLPVRWVPRAQADVSCTAHEIPLSL
jgi:cytochrome P450